MYQLAKLKFMGNNLKVPKDWQQPSGDPAGKQYGQAFKASEKTAVPKVPALFQPASTNKYHVDTAKKLDEQFDQFFNGISTAICSAWSTWQSATSMVGIIINAVTATGGQLVGPPWTPLILAQGPKSTPMMLKYTTTIANCLGTAWLSYTATIKVTGMAWYPAFAAVPSPVAPPAPNIPTPLAALTQVTASIMPNVLANQMFGMHGDPMAPYAKELFDAVADAFGKCFNIWQPATMVTNVLGTGPVPTFAPPYVPVGPVVGGVGTMAPGGLV
jgi:hypothetical protein